MPEYDPTAAHEALAPLHWDAEEFDFEVVSEDDKPKTDDEDLRLLFQEEPEENSDDCFSWDGADSSLEEEIDSSSVEEDPMAERAFRFLGSSEEESKENSDGEGDGWSGDDEASNGSSADESSDSDDDGDDSSGGDMLARSPKRRRH